MLHHMQKPATLRKCPGSHSGAASLSFTSTSELCKQQVLVLVENASHRCDLYRKQRNAILKQVQLWCVEEEQYSRCRSRALVGGTRMGSDPEGSTSFLLQNIFSNCERCPECPWGQASPFFWSTHPQEVCFFLFPLCFRLKRRLKQISAGPPCQVHKGTKIQLVVVCVC